MTGEEEPFTDIAACLDDLEHVPTPVLFDLVARRGVCMWVRAGADELRWTGDARADRMLAAPVCESCAVQRECLELEFRTAGPVTVGVWGVLDEEDRRAAYWAWLWRREGGAR